ncbi:EF-hand calcium-binding domain-containing protein 11-like [Bombus pyrosoma]|uniref:EF-hand calcium-binding domain-containing protein 11-like n=1 Tax=Bombus pyrosoma TaxID=396416 RepID=UPI001CB8A2B5|nr:EF-hand calcium-binding domain-containing protein 11-like [Bombus pyrosoma]
MKPNGIKDRASIAFNYADVDGRGFLSKREYKIAMTVVFGCRPNKTEVKQIFQSTERILYGEFESWVFKKSKKDDSYVNAELLFALLDKDHKGYLILDDFYTASKSVNLKVLPTIWQTMFKELDCYRKGYIDFYEFLRILPTT